MDTEAWLKAKLLSMMLSVVMMVVSRLAMLPVLEVTPAKVPLKVVEVAVVEAVEAAGVVMDVEEVDMVEEVMEEVDTAVVAKDMEVAVEATEEVDMEAVAADTEVAAVAATIEPHTTASRIVKLGTVLRPSYDIYYVSRFNTLHKIVFHKTQNQENIIASLSQVLSALVLSLYPKIYCSKSYNDEKYKKNDGGCIYTL